MNWDSLAADDFLHVDEVWADGWDDQLGTVPPRTVTDRAIHAGRSLPADRLIVHYMQPHQPFVGALESRSDAPWIAGNVWNALRRGEVTRAELWAAYRKNLEGVLDDVELLLENVDADPVVLSSDHGNAIGEWGIYGHPNGCLHPSVKEVPWIETTAEDTGNRSPDVDPEVVDTNVSDRLERLGYL
jgi:hypothetical protein